jgi:hypothetical protein
MEVLAAGNETLKRRVIGSKRWIQVWLMSQAETESLAAVDPPAVKKKERRVY